MKTLITLCGFLLLTSCANDSNSIDQSIQNNPTSNLISKMVVTQKQGNSPETYETYFFKYNSNNKVSDVLLEDNFTKIYEIKYNSDNKPSEFSDFDEPKKYTFTYNNSKLTQFSKLQSGQSAQFNVSYQNSDNTVSILYNGASPNTAEVYNFFNNNVQTYSNNGTARSFAYDNNENPFYKMFDRELFYTKNVYFEGFGNIEYMSKSVVKIAGINNINIPYTNTYDVNGRLIKAVYGDGYENYKLDIFY